MAMPAKPGTASISENYNLYWMIIDISNSLGLENEALRVVGVDFLLPDFS